MDKLTIIVFPAITFAIIAVGVVLYELGTYVSGLF